VLERGRGLALDPDERARVLTGEHREVVEVEDPLELLDRVGMIVDAHVDPAVARAPVAAPLLRDEEGRGLHPAAVAPLPLAGRECREQPVEDVAARGLECTTAGPTRMLPWHANPLPTSWPAQALHFVPVNDAAPPLASTTPSCRSSRPLSALVRRRTTSSADTPFRSRARPSGP